jgi:hypothetical protein
MKIEIPGYYGANDRCSTGTVKEPYALRKWRPSAFTGREFATYSMQVMAGWQL